MAPPVVVPDASVLLKWVLESKDEEDRDHALELRERWLSGECTVVVPSLWLFEVGNIVGAKQPDLASELMQILIDYRFEEEPATAVLEALELMRRFKVTFYDASYHAVALHSWRRVRDRRCQLLPEDVRCRPFHEACRLGMTSGVHASGIDVRSRLTAGRLFQGRPAHSRFPRALSILTPRSPAALHGCRAAAARTAHVEKLATRPARRMPIEVAAPVVEEQLVARDDRKKSVT